jgi:5-methylcytosine-specific restriction endonuclease McrA
MISLKGFIMTPRQLYQKEYRLKNRQKRKEYQKKWLNKNKEKNKTKRHIRYLKNKEKELKKNREWQKNHPEYNKTYKNEYMKKYNPEYHKKIKDKYGLGMGTVKKYGFKKALFVYDKFGRKCVQCGEENDLTIHHLDHKGRNFVNKGLKPNNNTNNLIILCRRCHGSLHGKEGKGIKKGGKS